MISFRKQLVALSLLAVSSSAMALSANEQSIHDKLTSGELTQIKQAAQTLVATNNANPELLDPLAEFVAQKYLTAANYELDTIAWACRALGESGNARYRDLLQSITDSKAHKKIRKYAKKSLRMLPKTSVEQYKVGSSSFTSSASNIAPVSEQTKQFNIASGNLVEIKMLAQRFASTGITATKTGDVLAQYFAQNYTTNQSQQYDTLAWICKALATDSSGRYKTIIESGHNSSPIRAVRKHCPEEVSGDGPYYIPGTIDLTAIAAQQQ